MLILPFFLSLQSLLALALAVPGKYHDGAHDPRLARHGIEKRQTAAVPSAVSGAFASIPTWAFSSNAYLISGKSVSLLPLTPASISSTSYINLTRILPTVLTNAVESSTHSWEVGALVESLLECYVPKLGAFEFSRSAFTGDIPWAALWVVESFMGSYDWTGSPGDLNVANVDELADYLESSTTPTSLSPKPLIDGDGSLGDPVSLGAGVWLLARYSMRDDVRAGLTYGLSSSQLAWAVGNQVAYLQQGAAADNGTISHREGFFQAWSDMGSMIPPFPAYIGGDTSKDDLLQLGLDQWILESSTLLDTDQNLYRHINDFDASFWATGNGWMVHGAMRVLASVEQAGKTTQFQDSVDQITSTLGSVFTALFNQLDAESLLPNYMLSSDQSLSGSETAGTALVTAAYYRFADMFPSSATAANTAAASKAFDAVVGKLDSKGWLTQVVNPMGPWTVDGSQSPEAQAFLGMLWAARTSAGI